MLKELLRNTKDASERKKILRRFQTVPPKTDDWLHDWVHLYLGVYIPRTKVCPHHVAPFTAFADAFFARNPIAIWKASRGFGGKTMLLSVLGLTELILLGANIRLLGGSGDQSQNINDYMRGANPRTRGTFWDAPYAPRHLLEDKATRTTRTEIQLANGGYVKALMASQTSVRGAHPSRLRLDECDEMEQSIFDAAMGQTMAHEGVPAQTVASSTHQHPDGTFTEAMRRARRNGWPRWEWCFRESMEPHGWLPEAEVERKRNEVPKAMWDAEFEGQEPNPEDRIFSNEALEVLFNPVFGEFEGAPGESIEILDPGTGRFFHGADWGKSRDWSVFTTYREAGDGPDVLARWERRGREDFPVMVGAFEEAVNRYGGDACYDATTGMGSVVGDYLSVRARGLDFSKTAQRDEMLNRYISEVEDGALAGPMIRFAYDEHKYLTREMVYGRKHLPDSVASAALSRWAKRAGNRGRLLVARI